MSKIDSKKLAIEIMEYDTLKKINLLFQSSIEEFNTRLDASKRYLDYITLPIIISSIEKKAYNPFKDIIEKYVQYIITQKMGVLGYTLLPLGYSSDLSFETNENIIHIEVKTANIRNPSDFKDTIPLGFNQTSYLGKLPLGIRGTSFYVSEGREPFRVYPNIPTYYEKNGKIKIAITNALIFIYPDYKEIMDECRDDYVNILSLIDSKLKNAIKKTLGIDIITNADIEGFLENIPPRSTVKRRRILTENIVRGFYLQKLKSDIYSKLNFTNDEKKKLESFFEKINETTQKLRERNIKPVAIISISIPNGSLVPYYDREIVSGKSYGKSIRYHYKNGIFKLLSKKEKKDVPRVIFLDYDDDYLEEIKKYFTNIYIFETKPQKITGSRD